MEYKDDLINSQKDNKITLSKSKNDYKINTVLKKYSIFLISFSNKNKRVVYYRTNLPKKDAETSTDVMMASPEPDSPVKYEYDTLAQYKVNDDSEDEEEYSSSQYSNPQEFKDYDKNNNTEDHKDINLKAPKNNKSERYTPHSEVKQQILIIFRVVSINHPKDRQWGAVRTRIW